MWRIGDVLAMTLERMTVGIMALIPYIQRNCNFLRECLEIGTSLAIYRSRTINLRRFNMKTLVRYNPKSLDVFENFDRMFNSLTGSTGVRNTARPAVDIREDENSYVLEAELPGHTEDSVEVKLDDNLLTISTKDEESDENKQNGYVLRERRYASFTRSFVLPKDVNREDIQASFSNGLLTLELRKSPESKPRQIEVKKAK